MNFADDVGQSLTNWASAFGSIEMVQYLCDKGSDVNKGHKSSSLHYAACFGRPDVSCDANVFRVIRALAHFYYNTYLLQ